MFPQNFLWGAATSSHQVEGGNTNNDWYYWEKEGKTKELSGGTAGHFALFENDFSLAQELGHNAHRFSIEWSRIEPHEGEFSEEALSHYHEVIRSLREKKIEPIMTLHHFTNPKWFCDQGGWLNDRAVFWFSRYAEKIARALGQEVIYWITINEPNVFAYHGYLIGLWPPGIRSLHKTWKVMQNLVKAHRSAYHRIHEIYKERKWQTPQVSIAQNFVVFKVCPQSNNIFCHLGVFLRHHLYNLCFLREIKPEMDFIGVNYYSREIISNHKFLPYGLLGGKCNQVHGHVGHLNTLFWDSCPAGLFEVLCWLKRFQRPLLITENGTCEEDDRFRWQFIEEHLTHLQKAIDAGAPVIGYLYWSLIDNFEWHHGFKPRFGIIEVDYKSMKRIPRESAYHFRDVIRSGKIGEGQRA